MNAQKILRNQRLSKLFRRNLLSISGTPEGAEIQTLGEDADPAEHPSLEPFFGSSSSNPAKIDQMLDDSIYACGLAAAQCGEALPHRCVSKIDWRLRLGFMRHSLKKKKWSVGKAEPFRPVRRQSHV
jgi:hypothetical protein